MCGIVGSFQRSAAVNESRLRQAAAMLRHRGPDDTGLLINGAVAIAQTRLSIIDLAGGHQPLFADDGNLALVANGEIYNHIELRAELERHGHVFATHSDCEVILHGYRQWGEAFLSKLNGMFAFALYDKRGERLLLGRDRLGIKPLFLATHSDGIAFASEIKALLPLSSHTPAINPDGLAQYLQNQFNCGPTTIFQHIERILPGEALWIERGAIQRRWHYWSALDIKPRQQNYEQAKEEFDALMPQVMKEHLRSDVPWGLFLSGGLDSSILLALLTRYSNEPIRTFSVGFADTTLTDEAPLARMMAERYGSRHTEIRPTRDDIFLSLPHTVWAADDLMRDYANLPTALLAQAAGRELKVVFSGEGGDEAFAGYGRYRASRFERFAKSLLHPGSGGFRTSGNFSRRWQRQLFAVPLREAAQHARRPFVDAWQSAPRDWSDLQRMQYVDLVTALPDNLLVKTDRMLMAASLEGRVPFLDHRVVEFGLALPDALKIDAKQGKVFLKRWAHDLLPESHLQTKKRGFHVPVGEWLTGEYLARLKRVLPTNAGIRAWFHPAGVAQLLDSSTNSGAAKRQVWALLQFAVWHRLFIEGNGTMPPMRMDPLDVIG